MKGDNTALHWSAMRGHVEIVKVLLAAGADAQMKNAQVMDASEIDFQRLETAIASLPYAG